MLGPVVLAAGLLGAAPAAAEDSEVAVNYDRDLAIAYWHSGGDGVRTAAEQALLGSDQDVRGFL